MSDFIFDIDGTLVDSYPYIITRLMKTLEQVGLSLDKEALYKRVISSSIKELFLEIEKERGISSSRLYEINSSIDEHTELFLPFPNVASTLSSLKENGSRLFIVTNRGKSLYPLLSRLGLLDFFIEIIDSDAPFVRKPDPAPINYLLNKYGLDKNNTYYVGDRKLDIDAANNAGIKGILFDSAKAPIGITKPFKVIKDFKELLDLG